MVLLNDKMQIEIPKKISENIEKVSQELGLDKKELIARAIILYLHSIKEHTDLIEEIKAWEKASIEDSLIFEKQVWKKANYGFNSKFKTAVAGCFRDEYKMRGMFNGYW